MTPELAQRVMGAVRNVLGRQPQLRHSYFHPVEAMSGLEGRGEMRVCYREPCLVRVATVGDTLHSVTVVREKGGEVVESFTRQVSRELGLPYPDPPAGA